MKKSSSVPNYDNWPRKRIKITDLFLDPENIRLQIEGEASQETLINDLFFKENAIQILESIALNGFFPDEVPVVIEENKKLVVIDGNRRVSALKVLSRPEIIPAKESQVKEFLKNAISVPQQIEVVVAPNRDSVRHFLASKHTQNTRRPWQPLRQAYFYKTELDRGKSVQDLKNEYPGVDIDRFLRLLNVHKIAKAIQYDSDQLAQKVHNERKFPASTIERLYEDKQVRDFLGFDFDKDGEVKVKIEKNEFEKGFKKVVQDVVDKVVDSRSLNNEKNRKTYLSGFQESEIPKKTKTTKAITSKSFKEVPLPKRPKRTKLAPRDIQFSLPSQGVRRMLYELQEIDYHRFPNASHDLLRSFLECALKVYFDQKGSPVKPAAGKNYVFLDQVLKEFKNEMDKIKNTELSQVAQKIISDTNMQSYSAQFLNATNHNPSIFATEKDVENAWDTMEKLFRYILNPPSQKNVQNIP